MRLLSLCAGIGGLELGVERAFGAHTVQQVDIAPETAAVRRRHWPRAEQLTGDLRTLPLSAFLACDVLTAGFPCQDLSLVGKRAGIHGDRSGLFFDVARIAAALRPEWVVFENVPALLSKYRGVVDDTLARAGYGVTWVKMAAANVGAPHTRRRVFGVARLGGAHGGPALSGPPVRLVDPWATPCAHDAKDTGPSQLVRKAPELGAVVRWPSDGPHPPPDHRLSPGWVEGLMGLPLGWTSATGGALTVDPEHAWPAPKGSPPRPGEAPRTEAKGFDPDRRKRLKMLGNAVVWQQAEAAVSLALTRASP